MSDSLSGHRHNWAIFLARNAGVLGYKLNVVTINNEYEPVSEEKILSLRGACGEIKLCRDVRELRQFLLSKSLSSTFLIIEVDQHLAWLTMHRIDFRGIEMRPYCNSASPKGLVTWLSKRILVKYLNFLRRDSVKSLEILLDRKRGRCKTWVQDDISVYQAKKSLNAGVSSKNKVLDKVENAIVVPGFLDARKNPSKAIAAYLALPEKLRSETTLQFVGTVGESFPEALPPSLPSNIQIVDVYLSEHDYISLLKRAKVILLPYSNRGASGVVIESMLCKTPVVISGNSSWKNLQKSSQGLFQVVKENETELTNALLKALEVHASGISTSFLERKYILGVSEFLLGGVVAHIIEN